MILLITISLAFVSHTLAQCPGGARSTGQSCGPSVGSNCGGFNSCGGQSSGNWNCGSGAYCYVNYGRRADAGGHQCCQIQQIGGACNPTAPQMCGQNTCNTQTYTCQPQQQSFGGCGGGGCPQPQPSFGCGGGGGGCGGPPTIEIVAPGQPCPDQYQQCGGGSQCQLGACTCPNGQSACNGKCQGGGGGCQQGGGMQVSSGCDIQICIQMCGSQQPASCGQQANQCQCGGGGGGGGYGGNSNNYGGGMFGPFNQGLIGGGGTLYAGQYCGRVGQCIQNSICNPITMQCSCNQGYNRRGQQCLPY